MMRILEKIKGSKKKNQAVFEFCLQTIRFKKLLENSRALLELFADANEKIKGDYILDRQYVTSLIDSIIERLGMMVYDGSILAPLQGEDLYKEYDKHVLFSRDLLGRYKDKDKKIPGSADTDASLSQYPEYQLLYDVLSWANSTESNIIVMDLMKNIFAQVIKGMKTIDLIKNTVLIKNAGLKTLNNQVYLIELWKDAVSLVSSTGKIEDSNSIPAKLLFKNLDNNTVSGSLDKTPWISAASEFQIALNSLNPEFLFRIDANISGYKESDFIFIFTDRNVNLETILPPGFIIEETDIGRFAWNINAASKTIEENLMAIGRTLFNEGIGNT